MEWYKKVLTEKYSEFSGRARRAEYWWFFLINSIISWPLYILGLAIGGTFGAILLVLFFIYVLATLIPSIAVLVRRLHDGGRSGWYYFIGLIPFIGGFIVLWFLVQDSQHGANEYGPSPKY